MKEIMAIDSMCRLGYCKPEVQKKGFEVYEMQVMARTTFAGVMKRLKLKPGEEWKVLAGLGKT